MRQFLINKICKVTDFCNPYSFFSLASFSHFFCLFFLTYFFIFKSFFCLTSTLVSKYRLLIIFTSNQSIRSCVESLSTITVSIMQAPYHQPLPCKRQISGLCNVIITQVVSTTSSPRQGSMSC